MEEVRVFVLLYFLLVDLIVLVNLFQLFNVNIFFGSGQLIFGMFFLVMLNDDNCIVGMIGGQIYWKRGDIFVVFLDILILYVCYDFRYGRVWVVLVWYDKFYYIFMSIVIFVGFIFK